MGKKYKVRITETLCRDVYVEADTSEQAYDTVDTRYSDSDIVLDSGDFVDVDIDGAVEVSDEEFDAAVHVVEVTDDAEG